MTSADLAHRERLKTRAMIGQPIAAGVARVDDFDDLYAAHYHSLTLQLYAYTGDRHEAQDVVQEAFCRAFARWKQISTYDDPVAWVRRVAWNLASNRWRKLRNTLTFARKHREEHAPEPSPDRVALSRALAALPTQQRRAVILFYLADLPISEIAAREGVADGTVKSWLHRARLALADHLTIAEPNDV
jgi:RNA polymerase sigma-70 factor (ECF subfamily)